MEYSESGNCNWNLGRWISVLIYGLEFIVAGELHWNFVTKDRGGDGFLRDYANLRSGGDYCIPLRQNLLQQRTLCEFVCFTLFFSL